MRPAHLVCLAGLVLLCFIPAAHGQEKPPPTGTPPGGFRSFFPQPGEILGGFLQDQLKLTAEQKKRLAEMQKDVDARLASLLTAEQKKTLDSMKSGKNKFNFGPPGFGAPTGPPPPGGVPGGAPPKGLFGPPGGFGPFGGMRTEDIQKKVGATDEEWKVIGPKLQKVMASRRALSGDAGPFGGPASSPVAVALADLKTVLEDPKHTKDDVAERIAAIRKAREHARTDLEQAQRDLSRLLTPGQQAILVSLGHLD